jgi:hypothetical protein
MKVDREEDPADREDDNIPLKISVTNTGPQAITGPVSLVFDDLNPESYVLDPDGSTTMAAPTGSFYIDFTPSSGQLMKGQTETRIVRFVPQPKPSSTAHVLWRERDSGKGHGGIPPSAGDSWKTAKPLAGDVAPP